MNGQPMPQQPMPQQPAPAGSAPQGGARIALYIVSFLFNIVGIIIGIIYMVKPDPDSKKFGKMCLILGIIGIAIVIIWYIVWMAIFATAISTIPASIYY